jgi:predicted signal transduction protein with EAL and GGDEF domain
VISLSREFRLTVVAEGVESELTLDLLEEMGCEIGQGYLFSRPLPYERLEAWFNAQTEPNRPRPARYAGSARSSSRAANTPGIRFHRRDGSVYSYPCAIRDRSRAPP